MNKCRERGENWSKEEKDLFLEVIRQSSHIIECKKTDTNTNKIKSAEWRKIQIKLMGLTGKKREVDQLKGFWRRIKMAAKKNVSEHKTIAGLPPPLPSLNDLKIMEMCTTDYTDKSHEYDECNGIEVRIQEFKEEIKEVDNDINIEERLTEPPKQKIKNKSNHRRVFLSHDSVIKKRSLEILNEEHNIKMAYHCREQEHQEARHKLEIELLHLKRHNMLLEKEKKELEIQILKKQLD